MSAKRYGIAALALLLVVVGCEQAPPAADESDANQPARKTTLGDVQRKAAAAAEAGLEYLQQKKEEYQRRLTPALEQAQEEIEQLKERMKEAADDARPAIEKQIEELEKNAAAAREKLDKLREASGPAWEQAQEGFEQALDELRDALEEPPATQPAPGDGQSRSGIQMRRITGVGFEFQPLRAADEKTLVRVTGILQERMRAAAGRVGQATVSLKDEQTVRVDVHPAVASEPARVALLERLCLTRGQFALRMLVSEQPENAAEIQQMLGRLATQTPRIASGPVGTWYPVADPVRFFGFQDAGALRTMPHNAIDGMVVGQGPTAFYVLACNQRDCSMVRDGEADWAVINAQPTLDENDRWVVQLHLDDPGAARIKEITSAHVGQRLGAFVDGTLVLGATIARPIEEYMVLGSFPEPDRAAQLAAFASSGPLPLELELTKSRDVRTDAP